MAARRTTQTARTTRTRTLRSGGGGSAAGYILPALVVGGLAYLLWPRIASAFVTPKPVTPPTPTEPITPVPDNRPTQQFAPDVPLPGPQAGTPPQQMRVRVEGAQLRGAPTTRGRPLRTLEQDQIVFATNVFDVRRADGHVWYAITTSGNDAPAGAPNASRGWIAIDLLEAITPQFAGPQFPGPQFPGRSFTPLMSNRPGFGF